MLMQRTTIRQKSAQTYTNAMSILVEAVVDERITQCSARDQAYLNRLEILAFALNQLPGLHATSEQGLKYQLAYGRQRYHEQIQQAVQRAFAAVLRDPILNYTPLPDPVPQAALESIRELLQADQVDWAMVPSILAGLIRQESPNKAVTAAMAATRQNQAPGAANDDAMTVFFQFCETLIPDAAPNTKATPQNTHNPALSQPVTQNN